MSKLEEYLYLARGMGRDEFVSNHSYPFLLLILEAPDTNEEWTFKTSTISSQHIAFARDLGLQGLTLSADASRYRVFPVRKSKDSPWSERISVGRARNNDITIPHKSVSKLHAHLSFDAEGQLLVVDAKSRNGVRINDKKINPGEPHTLTSGDIITFGAIALTRVEASELYDLVMNNLRRI